MLAKYLWIKRRVNPQLGTYYVPMGRISVKKALEYEEKTSYGYNYMERYSTEQEYEKRILELRINGERVRD